MKFPNATSSLLAKFYGERKNKATKFPFLLLNLGIQLHGNSPSSDLAVYMMYSNYGQGWKNSVIGNKIRPVSNVVLLPC